MERKNYQIQQYGTIELQADIYLIKYLWSRFPAQISFFHRWGIQKAGISGSCLKDPCRSPRSSWISTFLPLVEDAKYVPKIDV
jgi:hypothetical protein